MSINRILELSLQVAAYPPLRQPMSKQAYVPWYLINELRAELEKNNVDWKSLKSAKAALSNNPPKPRNTP